MRLHSFQAINDWISLITISILDKIFSLNPHQHIHNVDRNLAKHLSQETSYNICKKPNTNQKVDLMQYASPTIASAFNGFMNGQSSVKTPGERSHERNSKQAFIKSRPKF